LRVTEFGETGVGGVVWARRVMAAAESEAEAMKARREMDFMTTPV